MWKIISNILFVASLVVLAYFGYMKLTAYGAGDNAPDIEATLIDGTPFKLSDHRGRYVLIEFWASWCGPCRRSNPDLVAVEKAYRDRVTVVTVAFEKDVQNGIKAAELDGFTWKNQIVENSSIVMLSPFGSQFGISSIPSTRLIDPEGNILEVENLAEAVDYLNSH